ncbi:MAG TPA: glyoxalase, partial [Haliea salexigens]|nr:glyoxalase [Haliea salexigens]
MLNHVMIGSNNIEQSKKFYSAVLGVLGAGAPMEHKNDTGQTRLFYIHDGSTFSVSEPINGQPATPANGSTIGFACNSPEQVKQL